MRQRCWTKKACLHAEVASELSLRDSISCNTTWQFNCAHACHSQLLFRSRITLSCFARVQLLAWQPKIPFAFTPEQRDYPESLERSHSMHAPWTSIVFTWTLHASFMLFFTTTEKSFRYNPMEEKHKFVPAQSVKPKILILAYCRHWHSIKGVRLKKGYSLL